MTYLWIYLIIGLVYAIVTEILCLDLFASTKEAIAAFFYNLFLWLPLLILVLIKVR